MKDVKNKRIGGLDQSISEQAKASGSAIQEALKKQQAGKTSTATSGTSSGAASSILGSAGKTILGGGAIGGISATSPAVQGTARQAAAKTTPKSGSGTTGTGGGAATVTKPTNPYDNPESYGPENPYAKILAGIGGQGDNPYAGRMGQGGENPYAA